MSFFVNGGVSNCHYYISSFSGLAACRNGARRSSWMPLREGWSSKGRKNVKNRRPRRSKVLQAVCMDKSTFLRSLIPKEEIGAYRFLQEHPCYDGRGVVIAILDSGIDPSAAGLQVTSDGKPKIVDIIDCTGSCNVDTSKVVKADVDGLITGASGRCLLVNKEWKNPSGEWRIGYKFVYQLFPQASTARLKRKRREKWEKDHRKAFLQAIENLKSFDEKHPQLHIKDLQRDRKDLQSRICFLQKQEEAYYDKGPIIDVVVWNDGDVWRVAFDTQDLEEDRKNGKLANFIPLTNYRLERKYAVFSQLDACTFTVNIYNEGNCLSLITDDSSHGTHVSGIAAAYHPEAPLLNGIAPGAQLIVCKIGDTRLGSRKTGKSLIRALIAAVRNRCDIISMSCGGLPMLPNYGHLTRFIHEVVNKHGIIFVSSVGNEGPSLSTLIAPGGCSTGVIGVGAYLSPNIAAAGHCLVEPNIKGLEYTSSSRGPAVDGDIGVCLSAPGGAVASVPTWMLQRRKLKNGTSMATPCACGGVALLLSFMKAEGLCINPFIIRKALEETTVQIGDEPEDILSTGEGLMQVDKAYKFLKKCAKPGLTCYEVEVERTGNPVDGTG